MRGLHPAEPRKREVTKSDFHNVRYGSQADILVLKYDVCFTSKSGHWRTRAGCPLCATSGHQFGFEGNGPGTLYVIMGRIHITPDVDAISFTPQARQVL
jgi:hypothetical protein